MTLNADQLHNELQHRIKLKRLQVFTSFIFRAGFRAIWAVIEKIRFSQLLSQKLAVNQVWDVTVALRGYFSTSASTLVLISVKMQRLKGGMPNTYQNLQVNVYGSMSCKKK